jgi:hypothetical protein
VQQPCRPGGAGADQRETQRGGCQAFGQARPLQRRLGAGGHGEDILDQLGAQQAVRRDRTIEQRIRDHAVPARAATRDQRRRGDARL